MSKPKTDFVAIRLRLSPELHERLKIYAAENEISVNSAINLICNHVLGATENKKQRDERMEILNSK